MPPEVTDTVDEAVKALVPLPCKIPVRVDAPVPPSATVKSVIPVIVPPVIVAELLQKVGMVAYVVEALAMVPFVAHRFVNVA